MYYRKLLPLLLCLVVIPLYAQPPFKFKATNIEQAINRALKRANTAATRARLTQAIARSFRTESSGPIPVSLSNATPPFIVPSANIVSAYSKKSNAAARARLRSFARAAALPVQKNISYTFPDKFKHAVFEIQKSEDSRHTASAFALWVDGQVWGVAAGHVMQKIRYNPYAKLKLDDKTIVAQIPSYKIGNIQGSDVAIFKVPDEILPYIKVLNPAQGLPDMGTATQSPSFANEAPLYLSGAKVLFAGPHRILLQDQAMQNIDGSCGSPVLVDNQVVGVRIGLYPVQFLRSVEWNSLLRESGVSLHKPLHAVSPIQNVLRLIQEKTAPQQTAGIALKVLGKPVLTMKTDERIFDIIQIRNDRQKRTIYAHPFMNFERLEDFFDLRDGDVLRITIHRMPSGAYIRGTTHTYDVNVSTGETKKLVR